MFIEKDLCLRYKSFSVIFDSEALLLILCLAIRIIETTGKFCCFQWNIFFSFHSSELNSYYSICYCFEYKIIYFSIYSLFLRSEFQIWERALIIPSNELMFVLTFILMCIILLLSVHYISSHCIQENHAIFCRPHICIPLGNLFISCLTLQGCHD